MKNQKSSYFKIILSFCFFFYLQNPGKVFPQVKASKLRMIPFQELNKWGYKDINGKIINEPISSEIANILGFYF